MESSLASKFFPNLPKHKMTSFDSYNAKTTSISYPWPAEVNGIERIALSAQGDLQRVLSAFFARPIVIALVYSNTSRQASPQSSFEPIAQITPAIIASAAPDTPIVQTRQVHLQCNGKIVCTATSTVRITSPDTAHLFLQEKYAIGQMFRRLEKVPAFELLSVGLGEVKDAPTPTTTEKHRPSSSSFAIADADRNSNQLWRKYTLVVPHFECEILEVFPAREMFLAGERWLMGDAASVPELATSAVFGVAKPGNNDSVLQQGIKMVVAGGILLMLLFELLMHLGGKSRYC